MRYDEDFDFENNYEERTVSPSMTGDDARENELRPQTLEEYIGQEKAKETLKYILKRQSSEGMRSTTFFSMALPVLVKQHFLQLSLTKWALTSA